MIFPASRSQALFHAQSDTLTYEPYYGLQEKPFSLNTDLRFLFDSPSHASSLKSLLAGIRRREALLVLTGEIGMGKTTLCRAALRSLGKATFTSFVADPFGTREDLLKTLLIDFGAISVGQLTTGSLQRATRTELSYLLSGYLESMIPSDAYAVAIIDEAQNLSSPMIEATRMLCDSSGVTGRLQIVFVGQMELHEKLKSPEMRQVDQRISSYTRLEALGRDATADYIEHRLLVAGGSRGRLLFPPDVVDLIHRRTGGVPRLVNRVCDRALHVAHERQAARVDRHCLDAALSSIGSPTFVPTWASIVHADSPNGDTPAVAPTPAPQPVPALPVTNPPNAPISAAVLDAAVDEPKPLVLDDNFLASIDEWTTEAADDVPVEPVRPAAVETPPVVEKENVAVPARGALTAPGVKMSVRAVPPAFAPTPDRVWPKRLGIAAGMFALVAVIALLAYESPAVSDRVSAAPPSIDMSTTPPVTSNAAEQPEPAPSAPEAAPEYFVTVGLYATSAFAASVVNTLTAADLPATRRTIEVRGESFEQVVLGPFATRDDATTAQQRLRQLGGHDDARVIEVQPPPSQ